jgi:phosphatidate cytidylyltransferase
MLKQRVLVTLLLGPLAIFLIYLGGWFYAAPLAAILLLAIVEFRQLVGKLGWLSPLWLLVPTAFLLWFLPPAVQDMLLGNWGLTDDLTTLVLMVSLLLAMGYALWLYERRPEANAIGAWFATVAGIFLLGWLGSYFFRIRALDFPAVGDAAFAWKWTLAAMVGNWVADSSAFVVGKTLGRHKLSPRLSPNKTIEGYLGGAIVGTLLTALLVYFIGLPVGAGIVLGLLVSVLSPAGDLGISLLKREAKAKDSGHFLPGHGGALDRVDSLIWAVALAYFLAVFLN